jgi:hypothetical protein
MADVERKVVSVRFDKPIDGTEIIFDVLDTGELAPVLYEDYAPLSYEGYPPLFKRRATDLEPPLKDYAIKRARECRVPYIQVDHSLSEQAMNIIAVEEEFAKASELKSFVNLLNNLLLQKFNLVS